MKKKKQKEKIIIEISFHFIHRCSERLLGLNGTVEEIVKNLNKNLNFGYIVFDLQSTSIYFPQCSMVVPIVNSDNDKNNYFAKTILSTFMKDINYSQSIKISWMLDKSLVNKYEG